MNNFISTFEELDKLYESADLLDADDELLVEEEPEEIPAEEAPVEEPVIEEDETPKQLALECTKCGAVVIKAETEVEIDEATDLANVDDSCAYCDAAEGFKVVGVVVPYDADDEEIEIEDDEEDVTEALTEGKFIDNVKKVATRVGADAATIVRSFAELGDIITGRDSKFYDFAEYVENKAALKALMSGNEKVMNTLTKDDIEELKDDIAAYEKARADKKAGIKSEDEDLEELLDITVDARGFGGSGNDVSVL